MITVTLCFYCFIRHGYMVYEEEYNDIDNLIARLNSEEFQEKYSFQFTNQLCTIFIRVIKDDMTVIHEYKYDSIDNCLKDLINNVYHEITNLL